MTTYKTDELSQLNAIKAMRGAGSWSAGVRGMVDDLTREEKIQALKKATGSEKRSEAAAA